MELSGISIKKQIINRLPAVEVNYEEDNKCNTRFSYFIGDFGIYTADLLWSNLVGACINIVVFDITYIKACSSKIPYEIFKVQKSSF